MKTGLEQTQRGKTRFMLTKMLSSRVFAAISVVVVVMLSLMYYNTIQTSSVAVSLLPMPHSIGVSVLLGITIGLGIVSNVYVMKVIMGGGQAVMKVASRTLLSMLAGACGCASSIISVLLSLGIGVGSGALTFLAANALPFLGLAFVMSLVSIKLAANTLANVSALVKS
jgi:hypothetical protein